MAFYNGTTKLGEDTTAPYNYTWYNAGAGSHSIIAKAFDENGTSAVSPAVKIIVVKNMPIDSVVFAVDAGGPAYTASNGITYQKDMGFTGGRIYKTDSSIQNTTDEELYRSERFGNFSYNIPISKGTYEITFRFAEIYHKARGKRMFNVFAEDSEIINGLDIYAAAGANNADDIVKTVVVNDTILNIRFQSEIDYAKLSALHIKKLSAKTIVTEFNEIANVKGEMPAENIAIYPNPTSGLVNILSKNSYPVTVMIFDGKGLNIYKTNYAKKVHQLNLSSFSPGTYYIQILLGNKQISRKVLLMK